MQTQLKTLFDLCLTESTNAKSIQMYVGIHLMCFLWIWKELWLYTVKLFCILVAKSCFEMMPPGTSGLWRFSYIIPKVTCVASSVVKMSTWSPSTGKQLLVYKCCLIYILPGRKQCWGHPRSSPLCQTLTSMTNFRRVHDRLRVKSSTQSYVLIYYLINLPPPLGFLKYSSGI